MQEDHQVESEQNNQRKPTFDPQQIGENIEKQTLDEKISEIETNELKFNLIIMSMILVLSIATIFFFCISFYHYSNRYTFLTLESKVSQGKKRK